MDGLGNTWSTPTTTLTTAQQDNAMNAALKTVDGTATKYPDNRNDESWRVFALFHIHDRRSHNEHR